MLNWWRRFLSHEAGPLAQFVKYAVAGGLATASHVTMFYVCAIFLFPALAPDDIVVRLLGLDVAGISTAVRMRNAAVGNALAFVFANLFCYFLNRLFVFKPGRHHWLIELLLFFAVSGLSMLLGTAVQSWLIVSLSMQTTLAFGANLVTSLLINYGMRRFVIFKG